MRDRINKFLKKPLSIILIILVSAILTFFTGGPGYIFGMLMALIAFWGCKFNWQDFGIGKPRWKKSITKAILLAFALFILVDIVIQPLIEIYFGEIDLSNLDGIRGNVINYIIFLIFMWIVAAFGEEFLYRGFFMKQLAAVLGNTEKAWLVSAFAISILFGMAHLYQGVSGVITTGMIGLCLSLIFYRNRKNLVLAMLVHGFYDMIGLSLIFINKERIFTDWVQSVFLT